MATVTTIAQRILDENNYTDPSTTIVEYLIDNAIDYINLMAGTSIADLSGVAGFKSLVGSESENVTVKLVSTLMLRAYLDRGPNTAISGMSVVSVLADPQYDLFTKLIETSINQLRSRTWVRT